MRKQAISKPDIVHFVLKWRPAVTGFYAAYAPLQCRAVQLRAAFMKLFVIES